MWCHSFPLRWACLVGLKGKAKTGRAPACNLKDPRMPAFAIIVPCRLESTRFPRKLLHTIRGKPLVLWVAERIASEVPEYPLWFAVDHKVLQDCLESKGFRSILTRSDHASGTDRIAEANRFIRADVV